MSNEKEEVTVGDVNEKECENFGVVKHKYQNADIIEFTFKRATSDKNFLQFIALLDKLVDNKKPFVIIVDTRLTRHVPLKASANLGHWLRKRRDEVPNVLLGSSIVTNSKIVIALVNMAFSIQKPKNPNIITSDPNKAISFLKEKCKLGKKLD